MKYLISNYLILGRDIIVEVKSNPDNEEQFIEELSKLDLLPKDIKSICLFDIDSNVCIDHPNDILVARCLDDDIPQDGFEIILTPQD